MNYQCSKCGYYTTSKVNVKSHLRDAEKKLSVCKKMQQASLLDAKIMDAIPLSIPTAISISERRHSRSTGGLGLWGLGLLLWGPGC